MTCEDKELLLKDLCARQVYNVKCQVFNDANPYILSGVLHNKPHGQLYFEELDWKEHDGFVNVEYCKPYLFPLSSMTEEQREELQKLYFDYISDEIFNDTEFVYHYDCIHLIDWLNKNHFDVFGLIPLGLAIDATDLGIY